MEIHRLLKGDRFYLVHGISAFGGVNVDLETFGISECICSDIETWVVHYDFPPYLGGEEDITEYRIEFEEHLPDGKIKRRLCDSTKGGGYALAFAFPTHDEASRYAIEKIDLLIGEYKDKIGKLVFAKEQIK